jgi:hypothetical protein
MTTLNRYMQDTQRLLRQAKQTLVNPDDLRVYINRARREIAMRSQAIRVLTPISGSVVSINVTDGGSGYSETPTVTITDPDFPSGNWVNPNGAQATAVATVQDGVIVGIDVTYGGAGYFQPQVTITDDTGSGAEATASVSSISVLNPGQEQYRFSDIDLSAFPGVESVYFVRSVSIIYSNYRYSLPCYPFSVYQSHIRNYPRQYVYVPTMCSQFGQGIQGSLFFYPLPSQHYQVELDCQCLPTDLTDNLSVEALPAPWTDAVMYFAAHIAALELQNFQAAKGFLELYEKFAQRYSDYARAGRVINPYGRF